MEAGAKDDCRQRVSYFQKIRGDDMLAGVRLRRPLREALPGVPPPLQAVKPPGACTHACVCVYVAGQRGVFEESGMSQNNPLPAQPQWVLPASRPLDGLQRVGRGWKKDSTMPGYC